MLLWGRRCPQSTDPSQYEIGSKGKEQACSHLGITLEPSSMSLFSQCSRHQLLGALSPPFPDEPEEKASSVLLEIRPEGQMTLEINLQTDNPARGWNLCRGQGGRRPNRSEVACFGVQGQTGWILDSVGLRKGSRAEVNPSLHVKPYSNPRSNKDAWLNGSFICTTNNILV